jgi:hypothetical protein
MAALRRAFLLASALSIVALSAPADAFTATFALQIGSLPPVTASGSGSGTSAGAGGTASIPGGVFSIATTAPINPPLLVINGFGIGAPGQLGGSLWLAAGTNKALAFNGVTGTMGLDLSAYLITGFELPPTITTPTPTNIAAAIPLGIIGVGGTQKFTALGGLVMGSIMANPYQLGMVTLMGALNGVPSTVMGTGFDNRTASGAGTLQLVSPTSVGLGAIGALASLATLTLNYDPEPEPTTILLVGIGLVGLGAMRRRFAP